MKILVTAHGCNPNRGSEPGVGWHWVKEISKNNNIWVITRVGSKKNSSDLKKTIINYGGLQNTKFIFIPDSILYWWWPIFGGIAGWPGYFIWQWKAYLTAEKLHKKIKFDIAWNITMCSWRAPSFLWKLKIPFIWGPIGGGQQVPKGFNKVLGLKGSLQESFRNFAQYISTHDPLVKQTIKNASTIIVANQLTKKLIPQRNWSKCINLLETAIDEDKISIIKQSNNSNNSLKILWVGNIIPIKGLPILLWALSKAQKQLKFHLKVIGDGSNIKRCKNIVIKNGISKYVDFLGKLPYDSVQRFYYWTDIFVFTSLRDTSGNVVLEAMSKGIPVILMDGGGPKEMVGDAALTIPVDLGYQHAINELAKILIEISNNSYNLNKLSYKGIELIKTKYTWLKKGKVINQLLRNMKLSNDAKFNNIKQIR